MQVGYYCLKLTVKRILLHTEVLDTCLKAMNTGVGLFMILEGVEGEEPRGAQYMEWHENGTKKLESKILDYNEEGYRREDFTAWNQHNGQVGAQGQTWRRGSYVIDDGKIVVKDKQNPIFLARDLKTYRFDAKFVPIVLSYLC